MITHAEAIRDLQSNVCAGCNGKKSSGKSFCYDCYKRLPRPMAWALYDPNGYAETYENAKRCIAQRRQTAKQVGAGRHTRTR